MDQNIDDVRLSSFSTKDLAEFKHCKVEIIVCLHEWKLFCIWRVLFEVTSVL